MLIDIHTHIDDGMYNEDHYRVINSVDFDDFDNILELSKNNEYVFSALGIHPWYADKLEKDKLEEYVKNNEFAYIGETGLDYGAKACLGQEDVFMFHIELANKYNRPVMLHCYNASNQMYEMIKDTVKVPFLLHKYSDDINLIEKFVELGAYFSYPSRGLVEQIKKTPMERILSETDGKMYDVLKSVTYISETLGIEFEEVKKQIWKNSKNLLTLSNFKE
ncbi:MAG: putative deoxyribonuclease YcfH [Alphaproteobacteria bacterium ADurb.Bin438]|nr:MAG: putative deoxyribonuclease YcfH [Alphaproteobacteria bacterium ADurb.Bin438]